MGAYEWYLFLTKYLNFFFLYLTMCCFYPRFSGKRHVAALSAAVLFSGSLLHFLDMLILSRYSYAWYTAAIFLIALPFVLWYYRETLRARILLEIIYIIFLTGTRVFASNLIRLLFVLAGKDRGSSFLFGIASDVVSFSVLGLLCLFVLHSEFTSSELSLREFLVFDVIGITNLACFFVINGTSIGRSGEPGDIAVLVLINANILFTAFILCLVMFRYTAIRRQSREKERIIQNMQVQEQYMQQVSEALSQYRLLRHEMKNSLFYIDELVKEGEYGRLREYVDDSICRQESITDVIDTGRPIVSAMLNQKRAYARERGTDMEVKAVLSGNITIRDIHICTILSNLLDNAIRECEGLPDSHITVEIKPVKSYLAICVSNTTHGDILKQNPSLATTKEDKAAHGIGLKVVRAIVEENGGMMNIRMEGENLLSVECMLKNDASQPACPEEQA